MPVVNKMDGMPVFLYNMTQEERQKYLDHIEHPTLTDLVDDWMKSNWEYISFTLLLMFLSFVCGLFLPLLLL